MIFIDYVQCLLGTHIVISSKKSRVTKGGHGWRYLAVIHALRTFLDLSEAN